MRENSELKKTVNNLTKKGASGYLEAVVRGPTHAHKHIHTHTHKHTHTHIHTHTHPPSFIIAAVGTLTLPCTSG